MVENKLIKFGWNRSNVKKGRLWIESTLDILHRPFDLLKIKEYNEGVRSNCLVFYERDTYKDWLILDSWVLFIKQITLIKNSVMKNTPNRSSISSFIYLHIDQKVYFYNIHIATKSITIPFQVILYDI